MVKGLYIGRTVEIIRKIKKYIYGNEKEEAKSALARNIISVEVNSRFHLIFCFLWKE